tara:strand:- start:651 stop:1355 length:705 start_codon:yes stop_codon:yes gene_type:complete
VRLLYVPNLQKGCFELPEDEARHAIKVLRARVGDSFHLIDGKGGFADATIVEVGKRNCVVDVAEIQHEVETTAKLTMIVSPTKQTDRFEWFLEKAVEIGVDRVIPVWTTRSERKVEKHDRWQKVLVSAMKQSGRSWLPVLESAVSFEEAVEMCEGNLYIAHCMEAIEGSKTHLLKALKAGESASIAIGPEGDFTREEVKLALDKGALEISLGDSRLRTETAGIVAVTYFRSVQL